MKIKFLIAGLSLAPALFAVPVGDQDLGVEFYSPRTVRIIKTRLGGTTWKPFVTVTAKPSGVAVKRVGDNWSTDELVVKLDRAARTFSFWTPDGKLLLREKEAAAFTPKTFGTTKYVKPSQRFLPAKDETLYGLGDLENGKLSVRGIGALLTPGNVGDGIPYVVSDHGWAIWWDNTSPTAFHDHPGDVTLFESDAGDFVDYYFMYGKTGDGTIAEMRGLTGDVPMFPRWAYGYWQSRERYKTPQETVGVVEKYRQLGIPLDGIVQDWQYWGGNYLWNAMEFTGSDWRDGDWMIRRSHELNAKIIITIWQSFGPETKAYRELAPKGLLFPFETWPASGLEHIWPPRMDYPSGVRLCDNFSPITRDIYWKNLKRLYDAGIDGWWMDSTDPDHFCKEGDLEHPTAAGVPYRAVRNAYPISATSGVYEHQRAESNDRRVFILTRGASAGQQRFGTTVWSGDIASSWDVLRRQIPGGLNYTLTGNPQFNCDLGGFFSGRYGNGADGAKNVNYRELYARWVQLGAFLPMMRSHGTEIYREFYYYGKSGEEIYDALVGAVKMRYRLLPYLYSLAGHVTKDRASIMRPVWFDFAADASMRDRSDMFLLGDEILVTPVLKALYTTEDNKPIGEYEGWNLKKVEKADGGRATGVDLNKAFLGVREHAVALPKGAVWWDFEREVRHAGGEIVKIPVTMRSMPFFLKAGSILPLGPDVQYSAEKSWNDLEVRVYPGADGTFSFYEDAFDGYGYEKGEWSEIPFTWNDQARTLTIGARRGGYPGMLKTRTFRIRLMGCPEKTVTYDGGKKSITLN